MDIHKQTLLKTRTTYLDYDVEYIETKATIVKSMTLRLNFNEKPGLIASFLTAYSVLVLLYSDLCLSCSNQWSLSCVTAA